MEPARFCSTCKGQINRSRKPAWPAAHLCSVCAKRKAAILLIYVVVLATLATIALVLHRHLRRPGDVAFIGTPISSGKSAGLSVVAAPPTNPRPMTSNPGNAGVSPATLAYHQVLVKAPGTPYGVCGAPTKLGKPCQRKVKGNGFCWQHKDQSK